MISFASNNGMLFAAANKARMRFSLRRKGHSRSVELCGPLQLAQIGGELASGDGDPSSWASFAQWMHLLFPLHCCMICPYLKHLKQIFKRGIKRKTSYLTYDTNLGRIWPSKFNYIVSDGINCDSPLLVTLLFSLFTVVMLCSFDNPSIILFFEISIGIFFMIPCLATLKVGMKIVMSFSLRGYFVIKLLLIDQDLSVTVTFV